MEEITTRPIVLELYSYCNCFSSSTKLRPGFKLKNGVWCLTHTKPKGRHLVIDASQIQSEHFDCRKKTVYLTKALKIAARYNSISGGVIQLTQENQEEIGLGNFSPAFCLTSNFYQKMKLLKIDFNAITPITVADVAHEKITTQAEVEMAYEMAVAHETGGRELSADEKERVDTDTYRQILPIFQRAQLLSLVPMLFAFPTAELRAKFEALPIENLEAALNYADQLSAGNPTIGGSAAETALLEIATLTNLEYNVDGYAAATVTEAAEAIPADPNTTAPDNTAQYTAVLEEATAPAETTEQVQEDTAVTEAAPAETSAVATTKPTVSGAVLPRVGQVKEIMDLREAGRKVMDNAQKILDNFVTESAVVLDQIEAGNSTAIQEIPAEVAEVTA